MRYKLAISTALFGWLIFIAYLVYDYNTYGSSLLGHLLTIDDIPELIFHIIVFTSPIGSSITGYLINDRRRLLEKSQASEKRLKQMLSEWRSTLDSMPYGVMLIDNDFNVIRANKYMADFSGIPLRELSEKRCFELVHNSDSHIDECPLLRSIKTKETETYEFYNPEVDRHFLTSVTPILDDSGSVLAYSHPLIDITDMKRKEEKLIDSKEAFLNMLRDMNVAHKDLQRLYHDLIIAFSIAIDAKSPWTKGHSERVTSYAVAISREMDIPDEKIDLLGTAGLLHDIGKIGTYDVILEKPSRLSIDEFAVVKKHTIKGEEILKPIKEFSKILPIIKSHHEKVDGSGYPCGLKGDEIPLLARILCVADSFDSMISDRPYRPAPGRDYAVSELKRCSGTQFDSAVVEAFLKVIEKDMVNV